MTPELLARAVPRLTPARARVLLPGLEVAAREAELTTPLRLAMFLAQTGHE